jgi:hypothetical protein
MRPSDPITLAEAALALGQTYHQVRAMVLRGELKGGRDRAGRFFVERAALRAALRRDQLRGLAKSRAQPKKGGLHA